MRCSSFISDSATRQRRLPPRKAGPAQRGAVLCREWQLLKGDRAAAPYLEEAAGSCPKTFIEYRAAFVGAALAITRRSIRIYQQLLCPS
jgi:hypothetical protein